MHEMSLCQNILQIIEKECQPQNVKQVTDLWLEIGALSCVEKSSLEFCFNTVCRDTIAEGCQLHFIDIPAKAWCWGCSQSVELAVAQTICPHCGSQNLHIQQGSELKIKELAVK
ncbi:hydrogenase maturation nickel metallochaperone HypA [Actinobacillus pleuropneumoniae]|uniref:hydrogenase maturation nickel metallochaperone HypA n=1 Tax=Actinobacillus pleuropneumoniae TaxID=715 RepID=UPI001EED1098|nr:hydrogenase maturation nickel metallochaperone HypA [Actinobacillus pleuropneumoniae]UKH20470.1 hydrogenase maturation nickel metallochaperone HypA [Actinobacillus pleuropneumoniae]UPA20201.1 hydrogenase maturation nickel metallochaperone HypA [Actinobacillus pleuropneumoniae]